MADLAIQIDHTTKIRYSKGASDLTMRKRLFLAMLRRKGRVKFNQNTGKVCTWQVEFSQPPVQQITGSGGGMIDFSNHDAFRQLEIDWRGYFATDSISMLQKQLNSGEGALINLFQTKQNRLMKGIRDRFSGEFFKSGDGAGRENAIHGIRTFTTAGTVTAADRIAAPNGSYGGYETDVTKLGGGSWSANLGTFNNASLATDWPDGQGDCEYDALSPKLVNWSSNNWGTGSQTWEDNCWRVISQTITWLTLGGGDDGMPDICLLPGHMFQGYKNHEEAIRRISIPHKIANDLGFSGNVLNQDGVAISADFDCPANTGFMVNLSTVEVLSLFPELFWIKGPDPDPRTMWSTVWGTGFYGNCTWQPKHTAEIRNFAA